MRRWKPWALATCLAISAGSATAQSSADAVVQQLREQGYVEFEVTRTLLGRIRVVAVAPDGEQREIVFNPATGEILRDYSENTDGSAAPRILDRPADRSGKPEVSQPEGADAGIRGNVESDGNRGHGNDADGSDDDNPGQRHGSDSSPGGSQSGNTPSHRGGNGAKD